MKTAVIACKTIEDELNFAMQQTGCTFPVVWLEPGLHNVPEKLHAAVQTAIDDLADDCRVLLAMGFCGNRFVQYICLRALLYARAQRLRRTFRAAVYPDLGLPAQIIQPLLPGR